VSRYLTAFLLLAVLGCTPPKPTPSPEPTPTPTATPTPTPTPLPTPGPVACTIFGEEANFKISLLNDNQLKDVVRAAQANVGDVCGQPPSVSLCRLAVQLDKMGYPAGVAGDSVMVMRRDVLYEEHHAVYYGNGCWLSNTFRNVWERLD